MPKRIYFLIVKKLIAVYGVEKSKDLIRKVNSKYSKSIRIAPDTILKFPENITIGKNTYINNYCFIKATNTSKIIIDDDCLMSYMYI